MTMDEFSYSLRLDERLLALRQEAKLVRDPTTEDDTLQYILYTVKSLRPKRILEIGSAEGLTSIAMLLSCEATLDGLELDRDRAERSRKNLEEFGLSDRAKISEGDAMELLPSLSGEYDLIFLDGPKVQYRKYLPFLYNLLRVGGVLLSDDVLLYGWVTGEKEVPKKRHMLVQHLREYLRELTQSEDWTTAILKLGEGLAVSVKNKKDET